MIKMKTHICEHIIFLITNFYLHQFLLYVLNNSTTYVVIQKMNYS